MAGEKRKKREKRKKKKKRAMRRWMMAMVEGKIVAIDVKSGQNNILPYLLLPLLLLLLLSVHCNLTANIADTCLLVFIVGCWAFTVSDIVIRELVVVVGFLNCRINLFAAAHKLATFLIKLSSFVCLLACLCVCAFVIVRLITGRRCRLVMRVSPLCLPVVKKEKKYVKSWYPLLQHTVAKLTNLTNKMVT